jgi:hypothetical protein
MSCSSRINDDIWKILKSNSTRDSMIFYLIVKIGDPALIKIIFYQ